LHEILVFVFSLITEYGVLKQDLKGPPLTLVIGIEETPPSIWKEVSQERLVSHVV
jgi:hypothetical protein